MKHFITFASLVLCSALFLTTGCNSVKQDQEIGEFEEETLELGSEITEDGKFELDEKDSAAMEEYQKKMEKEEPVQKQTQKQSQKQAF